MEVKIGGELVVEVGLLWREYCNKVYTTKYLLKVVEINH